MSSNLINKRSIYTYMGEKLIIKKNFKSFKEIWDKTNKDFKNAHFSDIKTYDLFVKSLTGFAKSRIDSKNKKDARKA